MYQSVSSYDFHNAFKLRGRETQFSYEALDLLFNYLEELETRENPILLDVIAICCDYSECTHEEIANNYSIEDLEDLSIEDKNQAIEDFLNDNTILIGITSDSKLVYLQF
jgi:hypothetical protein